MALEKIFPRSLYAGDDKGWIFSRPMDISVFWIPVVVAYTCSFIFGAHDEPEVVSSINFLFGLAIFDAGHVLATAGPVFRRYSEKRLPVFWLGLCIMTAVALGSYLYSRQFFFSLVAPVAVFHVMKQQYGWLMLSRRKFGEPQSTRLWDQVFLWNVMIPPVLWWLSPLSGAEKSYYQKNDFILLVPPVLAQVSMVVYWLINTVYVIHLSRLKQPWNWGKISMLSATALWFFTLVLFSSKVAFFASLFYVHGLAYMLYSQRDFAATKFNPDKPPSLSTIKFLAQRAAVFLLIVAAVGLVWRVGGNMAYSHFDVSGGSLIEWLLWYPLLLHYYFDSFIWKGIDLELLP